MRYKTLKKSIWKINIIYWKKKNFENYIFTKIEGSLKADNVNSTNNYVGKLPHEQCKY